MANNDNSDDDNDGDDMHDKDNPYFVNSYSIPGGLISLFTQIILSHYYDKPKGEILLVLLQFLSYR